MKNKKLLAAIVAVTMSATSVAAFSGCTDKHTHDYTDWTVTTPATCTEDGVETGTCKADGQTSTRPVPALGHSYGDWKIVKPTANTPGSATKTCANDTQNEHPLNVVLPVLGDSAYTKNQLKDTPTYTENKYTFANSNGNIEFTAYADKSDVNLTVAQAIETANDERYVALIGSGEGVLTSIYGPEEEYPTEFSYEFGDGYTHLVGEDEFWLNKDAEGNISGIVDNGYSYRLAGEDDADYFDGYAFPNSYDYETYYGLPAYVASLYDSAKLTLDPAVPGYYDTEFTESVEEDTYTFSWTVVSLYYNEYSTYHDDNIYHVSVSFTLDENYMLETFEYTSEKYHYDYADDAELPYDFDEANKTYTPKNTDEPTVTETMTVDQTALADLAEVPVNTWNFDEIEITAFNMMKGYQVSYSEYEAADDSDPDVEKEVRKGFMDMYIIKRTFAADDTVDLNTAEKVYVYLKDFAPASAADYISLNPVNIYLVDGNEDTLIGSSEKNVYGTDVAAVFDADNSCIEFTSPDHSGNFRIKIDVNGVVKTFTLHVTASAPESLVAKVDVYNAATDTYKTNTLSYSGTSVTVYKNQTLNFASAGVLNGDNEPYLYDDSATATFNESYTDATLTETTDGYSFVASATGSYVVKIVSDVDPDVGITFTVVVEDIPDVEAMLDGEYTAGDFTLTFDNTNSKVTVSDGDSVNVEINYTYTVGGGLAANSTDSKYSVVLTEDYKLVLVYKDALDETQRALLKVPSNVNIDDVKAALAGTWKGSYSGCPITIVLDADGSASFDDGMGMAGPVALTWDLEDNGDGNYGITFSNGNFDGWYGVAETGSTATYDEDDGLTGVTFGVFDTMDSDTVDPMHAIKQ